MISDSARAAFLRRRLMDVPDSHRRIDELERVHGPNPAFDAVRRGLEKWRDDAMRELEQLERGFLMNRHPRLLPARRPSAGELKLIGLLLSKAHRTDVEDWLADLIVRPLDDGGMGSLRFLPFGNERGGARFGGELAEVKFDDSDGVPVVAALLASEDGEPWELDV